jgi:long-chain acyl-CoA synthetase
MSPLHAVGGDPGSLSVNEAHARPTSQVQGGPLAVEAKRPTSLTALLEDTVRKHGARTLFLAKRDGRWLETSYQEFADLVGALSSALVRLGVGAGDRVGIIAGNRIEWAVCAYATYRRRAALVPMYESQQEKEWLFIIRDSGMRVLFVPNAEIRERLARALGSSAALKHIVVLDGRDAPLGYASLIDEGKREPAPASSPAPADIAAILYTSGTTGEPKGVVLSHANFLANVLTMRDVMNETELHPEEHRSLAFLPWAHAFGHTSELHGTISAGSSLAIAESIDKIVYNLSEVKPTVLVAVPKVFSSIYSGVLLQMETKPRFVRWLFRRGLALAKAKNRGETLQKSQAWLLWLADRIVFARVRQRLGGRLKYAMSGAAALSRDVAEFVDAIGIVVYEGYGLTETSPIATANLPGQRKVGSVGRPIPGVRVVIDRSDPADPTRGEIVIYGPNVMRGYYGRERESSAAFTADGGFRTGDMGYLDEDGYLFITGRIKEQYKLSNGKYVVPSPLEEMLKVSPFIANVLVYGENRPHNVALVVPEPSFLERWAQNAGLAGLSTQDLIREPAVYEQFEREIQHLSRDFKSYERVKKFSLLSEDFTQENGLLTPSLKLKRDQVVKRFHVELARLYDERDV